MHDITSKEDLENLQATGKLVVIDWHAQWCDPCKAFEPTFQNMAEERTDVLFCKIDIGDAAQDEFHDLVAGHGVRSLPTFQASGCAIIRTAKRKLFFYIL